MNPRISTWCQLCVGEAMNPRRFTWCQYYFTVADVCYNSNDNDALINDDTRYSTVDNSTAIANTEGFREGAMRGGAMGGATDGGATRGGAMGGARDGGATRGGSMGGGGGAGSTGGRRNRRMSFIPWNEWASIALVVGSVDIYPSSSDPVPLHSSVGRHPSSSESPRCPTATRPNERQKRREN